MAKGAIIQIRTFIERKFH